VFRGVEGWHVEVAICLRKRKERWLSRGLWIGSKIFGVGVYHSVILVDVGSVVWIGEIYVKKTGDKGDLG